MIKKLNVIIRNAGLRFILVATLLISSVTVFGQTNEQRVEQQFIQYTKLIAEKRMDEALNYVNPGLFEVVSKESLVKLMNALFTAVEFEARMGEAKIISFEPLRKIDGVSYIKFKNLSSVEMKFHAQDAPGKSEEEKKTAFLAMKNAFETKFGKENVSYNEETKFWKLKTSKLGIASSEGDLKNWKFVVIDNAAIQPLLKQFIPEELLN